jgi:hypothetical protein
MPRILLVATLLAPATAIMFFQAANHARHRPSEQRLSFLSSDAHVVIGDVSVVVPLAALPGYASMGQYFSLDRRKAVKQWIDRRDEFYATASNPASAPNLDKLEIAIRAVGGNGYEGICPRLSRNWAKSVCSDPWSPIRQALPPNRFYLADDRNLEVFDSHYTVGGEKRGDQLRKMRLETNQTSLVCDMQSSSTTRFCTAAIRIGAHQIAVWSVWESEEETSRRQADREGKAIVAFVQYALGAKENPPKLVNEICHLRRPRRSSGVEPDSCAQSSDF